MSAILPQSKAVSQKMKVFFAPTALALLISACSTTNPVTESLSQEAYGSSESYINRADQTRKLEDQQTYRLLAVRKLIEENKVMEAQNTLDELNTQIFNELQRTEYQLLNAQLAALKGNNQLAQDLLKSLPNAQLNQSQHLRFYQTQAVIAENSRNVIDAVRARALMDNYLTDNKLRQENNDKIWSLLRNANRGTVDKALVQPGEIALGGWLSLAKLYNQNLTTPANLPRELENWKRLYPNHSANLLMPTELKNVGSFQQTAVNSVAVLLPRSGEAKILGDIILQGFNEAKGADETVVNIFDTDSAPIAELVSSAKMQGAQMIVGPLLKDRVDELLLSNEVYGVNVLALNSTPNARAIGQVCYYGLSPEEEAKNAADRMYRDGVSRAIVAAPQSDFGHRSAAAFSARWRQIAGTDADIRYYVQPLDAVASLQNSGVSNGAALYMLGVADEVIEIKEGLDNSPLAQQMPLYTSSRSNSPNNGIDFRTSMEGVKFSEIPLLADSDSEMYRKADSLAASDLSMMRLYAMGSDAWALAHKFNEFRQIPGYSISGLTGRLSAGQNCNIERSMTWLQYRNGTIETAY